MTEFLLLADIDESATNPRTRFDQVSINDLAKSIKQLGLIQAITVRRKGDRYELVAGARRYRASVIAETVTIEAKVRELNDDEVLEIQLVENLDRKDVHPLEEAAHFKRMLDTGHYTVEDIGHRIGKPEGFIVHRLKLNDLIEPIREDFFSAQLNLTQAALIARISAESQEVLFTTYKDSNRIGYGKTEDLKKEIEQDMLALENAVFSLEKKYEDLPVCKVCPFNTGNNPLLFEELHNQDNCTSKSCYRKKTDFHIQDEIRSIYMSEYQPKLAGKFKVKTHPYTLAIARDYGFSVLREFEDFKLDKNFRFSEEIDIYWIDGDKKGTYCKAYVTKPEPAGAVSSGPFVPAETLSQADKLQEAEKKAAALDAQKVHLNLVEALDKGFKERRPQPFDLETNFIDAMFMYLALLNNEFFYLVPKLINLGVVLQPEYATLEDMEADLMALTTDQKKQMVAFMLYGQCCKTTDPATMHGQIIRRLANQHQGIDVYKIQAQQDAIAAGRKAELEAKIAKLENPNTKKGK